MAKKPLKIKATPKPKIKATPKVKVKGSSADIAAWKAAFQAQADKLRKKVEKKDSTLTTTTRLEPPEPTIAQLEKWHEERKNS